jgi:hypothetical protein
MLHYGNQSIANQSFKGVKVVVRETIVRVAEVQKYSLERKLCSVTQDRRDTSKRSTRRCIARSHRGNATTARGEQQKKGDVMEIGLF